MSRGTQFDTFSYIYDGFDHLLRDYVLGSAARVATEIGATAYILMGVYILLWGLAMMRNAIEEPVVDGVVRLLKLSVILGLALNTGRYAEYIVDFFLQTPEAMAQVIVLGEATSGGSIGGTADALVQRVIDTASGIWDQAGVLNGNMGHYALAILVIVFGFVVAAVAFMVFLFAKFGLVFLLALGPIFLVLAMFDATRPFFEGWLRQLVTLLLTMIFILAGATFIFAMVEAVADRTAALIARDQLLQGVTQLGAVAVAGTVLLLNVKGLAAAVANGFTMSMGHALRRAPGMGTAMGLASRGAAATATGGASVVVGTAASAAKAATHALRAKNTVRRNA